MYIVQAEAVVAGFWIFDVEDDLVDIYIYVMARFIRFYSL